MNELLQSGAVAEVVDTQYVSYLLSDENLFLLTEYKVLNNNADNGLIRCSKLLYNGKIKLVYFIYNCRSLYDTISGVDDDTLLMIIKELIRIILDINANEFLDCMKLVLSFDRVFIDPREMTVKVIYLPVRNQNKDFSKLENDFIGRLIELIRSKTALYNANLTRICDRLSQGTLRLHELYALICEMQSQPALFLTSIDAKTSLEFRITKPEFILGREASLVDGALGFDRVFGRVHCKIVYQDNEYYIVDSGSINGTFVTRNDTETQVAKGQMYPIYDQDVVRLANYSFSVRVK